MEEFKDYFLNNRFLAEVIGAAIIVMCGGLNIFVPQSASSPQQQKVITLFVNYLFYLFALLFVYFVEEKHLRSSLFVPFSIVLLLLTAKYALDWVSVGSSGQLSNNTVWLYFKSLFNINFIPILIASFQLGRIVEEQKDRPFYALLIINYITILLYLFVLAPILSRFTEPRVSDIFWSQFVFYFIVYFLFAYAPYFSRNQSYYKGFSDAVKFALKRFIPTVLISVAVVIILYIFPFILSGLQSITPSQNNLFLYNILLPILMFYFFPTFYIAASFIARRYGK